MILCIMRISILEVGRFLMWLIWRKNVVVITVGVIFVTKVSLDSILVNFSFILKISNSQNKISILFYFISAKFMSAVS